MPAAFTGEEIPCRPKGWPAFRGRPRNRDFSRKKRCYPTYVPAASEICLAANFDAAAQVEQQIPRLAGLELSCPIAARYLWDILSGSYLLKIGRPTPGMLSVNWQRPPKAGGRKAQDCGRERACSLAPKAQPVAPGGERVIHSSRPPDGGEKAFLVPFGA